MGKCLFLRKGETHTAPVTYKANFSDNTWEQIIDACQKNKVPNTWLVADQKAMTINGTDYMIDIIGKNHDTYSDGSGTAPLTFQLHDCYGTSKYDQYSMNSKDSCSGGWAKTKMRLTTLPSILELMPEEVQNNIREVDKLTCTESSSIAKASTTADKLFILSEIEIFGSLELTYDDEGTQYDYYKAGNSTLKKINGSYYDWWMRSLYSGKYFCIVNTKGAAHTDYASNVNGVSFAFCF